jgi:hypothetical protein
MRMRFCYLDCHEDRLCRYLVMRKKTYYVLYSCFTPICGLFTDSSSNMYNSSGADGSNNYDFSKQIRGIWVPQNEPKFLVGWVTYNFSNMTQLHETTFVTFLIARSTRIDWRENLILRTLATQGEAVQFIYIGNTN